MTEVRGRWNVKWTVRMSSIKQSVEQMDAHINTSVNWSACADVRVGMYRWAVGGAAVVSIANLLIDLNITARKRSYGKVMFSHMVIHRGSVFLQCHGASRPTPQKADPLSPQKADPTPRSPEGRPFLHIWSTGGRNSYWNAYVLCVKFWSPQNCSWSFMMGWISSGLRFRTDTQDFTRSEQKILQFAKCASEEPSETVSNIEDSYLIENNPTRSDPILQKQNYEYFITCPLVHYEWIFLLDKLIFT